MSILEICQEIAKVQNQIDEIKYPSLRGGKGMGYVACTAMLATLVDCGNGKKQIQKYVENKLAELTQELSDLSDKVSL